MSAGADEGRDRRAGLTSAEVEQRVRDGLTNAAAAPSSRSVADILRTNVFTFFNGLLAALFAVIIVFGDPRDALFGFVVVINAAIGIVQELRAKRTLDRLSVLSAPRARVVRDGTVREVPVSDVVLDEVIELRSGDEIVADGVVLATSGLEIDEALLTGESKPVAKATGATLMSGSACVAGAGLMRATAVGADAYARKLAAEARRFKRVPSELRRSTDLILRTIAILIVPVAALLLMRAVPSGETVGEVVPAVVGALVGMIPQGLVLLTSLAFAVSVIELARTHALIEELAAVEVLARVDVVCFDKTGTLTEPELEVLALEMLDGAGASEDGARGALAALARIDAPDVRNATARALAAAYPGAESAAAAGAVPFSSARKWSAVDAGDGGAWVLGAAEFVLPEGDPAVARARARGCTGARVVLLARTATMPTTDGGRPADASPVALVSLEERVRDDAAATIAYFREQGVTLKVISGDAPATVAAVAARAGLEIVGEPADGAQLPTHPDALAAFMDAHSVFGRVRPEQKRDMVAAMQSVGHVVAMTGDGVNDALALKTADMGIAMGSGAGATRAVAELVLLDGKFSHLPDVLTQGRRVVANIERVANLFVTKTVYAALLAVGAGIFGWAYPLLPRHFTLIDSLTIGIPGFFLALAPAAPRYRPGLLPRVMRFTLVSGAVIALAATATYLWALGGGAEEEVARTVAVLTIGPLGLWVLAMLARPLNAQRAALVAAMAALFAASLAIGFTRDFFALLPMPAGSAWVIGVAIIAGSAVIEAGLRMVGWRPRAAGDGTR